MTVCVDLGTLKLDMGDSSAESYIRMVQHLIETCLLFHLSMEECMELLKERANIMPVITSTVWKEMKKENEEFFEEYECRRRQRTLEEESLQKLQRLLLNA